MGISKMEHQHLHPVTKQTIYFGNLQDEGRDSLRTVLENNKMSSVTVKPIDGLSGRITLKERIQMSGLHNVIIDFDKRIEIKGWALELRDCLGVVIINAAVRIGDKEIRQFYKGKRPQSSNGLDCINIDRCQDILISKCSLWSSCDEIVSVTRSINVHVERSLLVFPLGGDPLTHPYGDYHAECANCSANSICCFYRCVFAYYRMRGPQFEPNDASPRQNVVMQAANNVMYGFKEAGSRYRSGPEKKTDKVKGATYKFQFLHNLYITPGSEDGSGTGDPIVCDIQYKPIKEVSVYLEGNLHWNKLKNTLKSVSIVDTNGKKLKSDHAKQIKKERLFTLSCVSGTPIISEKLFLQEIVAEAGINDSFDTQAKKAILSGKPWRKLESYNEVLEYLNLINDDI